MSDPLVRLHPDGTVSWVDPFAPEERHECADHLPIRVVAACPDGMRDALQLHFYRYGWTAREKPAEFVRET